MMMFRPTTAGTGMLIRQQLRGASSEWSNSPDVIVTGASPAFDETALSDTGAYDWFFSQAPVFATANYLYIRALNLTDGAQTSRVYLYFAQSDQVLDPTKWQASGFTVGGVTQAYVELSAINKFQLVETGAQWTPPTPTTAGASYYLITWVDNSAAPAPPVFPTTAFASLDALGAYVTSNPTMAVLDTVYRGAFIRQYPSQSVTQDGNGHQTSPDLIVAGPNAATDASAYAQPSSYNPGVVSANAATGTRNFVYVRAVNTAAGPATARVYLYWANTTTLSAPSWQSTNFTFAGTVQNWVDLSATASGEVMVSTVPVVWNAPSVTPGQSYVLIAYVDNSSSPQPPDFTPFGYLAPTAVTSFVAGHPQLAWVAVAGTPAPASTMAFESALSVGTGGTMFYIGLQLSNVPTDGTISLSIPGPDAANTVVASTMKIPDPNALIAWEVTYRNGFASSYVVTYTAGASPVGAASITPQLVPRGR